MLAAARATPYAPSDRALDAIAWSALVGAVLVLAHPYAGIMHDGILYYVQALARLHPEIYANDVYFRWGSQDRYSVFSPFYTVLIQQLGTAGANILLVVASQALFLGASFLLIRKLVEPPLRGFGLLMVAASNGVYGGWFIFRMAEPFVTPRPFAEAATLIALALLGSGRRVAALAVLFGAALLHPLVALVGLACAWIYLVGENRRWLWAAALAVPALIAAAAGVEPFAQLLRRFDPEWLQTLMMRNQHLFALQWTRNDWMLVACDVAVAGVGLHLASGFARRLLAAVLILAGGSLVATLIGADLAGNVLVTNLQFWRSLWLLHWVSAALVPFVAWRLWRLGGIGELLAGLAVFTFVFRGLPAGFAAAAAFAAAYAWRARIVARPALLRLALLALPVGGLLNWHVNLQRSREIAFYAAENPVLEYVVRALSKPFVLVVLGSAIAFWLLREPRPWQKAALAAGLACVAVLLWDQRVPMKRYIESVELGAHPFSRIVGPHDEVFWHGDVVAPWILMQRRSYLSGAQQAGQMFHRETAIELERRRVAIEVVEIQEELCLVVNALNRRSDACAVDVEAITAVCKDAPGLDFVVLGHTLDKQWVASWTPPVEMPFRRPYYYLYDCKKLVAG